MLNYLAGVMPVDLRELSDRVMRERGWTQSQLARELGVSPGTVGKWVRGEAKKTDATTLRGLRILAGMAPDPAPSAVDEIARLVDQFSGLRLAWAKQVLELAPRISERQQQLALDVMREMAGHAVPAAQYVADADEAVETGLGVVAEPQPRYSARVQDAVDEPDTPPERATG